ncbi:MAG: hypothetical protein HUK21_07685 [Fibrobacteraceae bacterium]|nr:hypothetical protein [Fibrobacteraceae bacterium]
MSCSCPFCKAPVACIDIHHLNLRICTKCFSTFFPCDQTMAFRGDLIDKTRELWLLALKAKNVPDPETSGACCIDHGEPLVDGNVPDYGFPGKVTTCCRTFHFTPSQTVHLLEHTLKHPSHSSKKEKHHFFFIRALDRLIVKLTGEAVPEEDTLDLVQYNLNFKKLFE